MLLTWLVNSYQASSALRGGQGLSKHLILQYFESGIIIRFQTDSGRSGPILDAEISKEVQ